MLKVKWASAFLVLGLLVVMQSFAGTHDIPGSMIGKGMGDHHEIAMYYEAQAQADKSKAENWEFMADYYAKYPQEYSGKAETLEMHVAHLRSVAGDLRKSAEKNQALAAQHRSMARQGVGP